MGTTHTITQVEGSGALFAAGRVQINGTTLTLTQISTPLAFQSDITAVRVGAGRYQITLQNFRGPQGIVIPTVSAGSTASSAGQAGNPGLSCGISLNSYTANTDTYSFTIGITSTNSFVDAEAYFQVFGF